MYRLGLVGYPLEHSMSPWIQQCAMRIANIKGEYRLYPVSPFPKGKKEMQRLILQLKGGVLNGLNITIPHKQTIISFLDRMTPAAQAIGAVNTLFISDSKLVGDNSDAPGFLADLSHLFIQKGKMDESPVGLVLGAGGAARAVAYALRTTGWEVYVAARGAFQAIEMAAHIEGHIRRLENGTPDHEDFPRLNGEVLIHAIDLKELVDIIHTRNDICLVVNATPVGMVPGTAVSPWPQSLPLPKDALVYDLVYNPGETLFLSQARQTGHETRNGWGMLIEQALISFERWTGIAVSSQLVLQALSKEGR